MFRRTLPVLGLLVSLSLARAGTDVVPVSDRVIVSVKDQKLMLVQAARRLQFIRFRLRSLESVIPGDE